MDQPVEMLSHVERQAVKGPVYPRSLGVVRTRDENDEDRYAYRHAFFRYDDSGQPIRDSLVEFYVPDYLRDGANPDTQALRLVADRMGWTAAQE